jgi:hypothetical protein
VRMPIYKRVKDFLRLVTPQWLTKLLYKNTLQIKDCFKSLKFNMINLDMLIKLKESLMMMYYNKKRDYKFKCLIATLNSMKNRLKDLEEK